MNQLEHRNRVIEQSGLDLALQHNHILISRGMDDAAGLIPSEERAHGCAIGNIGEQQTVLRGMCDKRTIEFDETLFGLIE